MYVCMYLITSWKHFTLEPVALHVAFIHVEESGAADGTVLKEFYSKLVKADVHGKDQLLNYVLLCVCWYL
ncbi:hypothetical protein CsSME_00050383 [Camellia sinensis var. sinensis]